MQYMYLRSVCQLALAAISVMPFLSLSGLEGKRLDCGCHDSPSHAADTIYGGYSAYFPASGTSSFAPGSLITFPELQVEHGVVANATFDTFTVEKSGIYEVAFGVASSLITNNVSQQLLINGNAASPDIIATISPSSDAISLVVVQVALQANDTLSIRATGQNSVIWAPTVSGQTRLISGSLTIRRIDRLPSLNP